MPTHARASSRRGGVAAVLLLAGLLCWALFRVVSGTEHHVFSVGAVAPDTVAVHDGATYDIAVHGGVDALTKAHASPTTPQCSWSSDQSALQLLQVTAAADDKATNVVGTFVAPVTGSIHVQCTGWGPVFVDDADNASGDASGYLLVLAVIALTIGAGLAMSAMWTRSQRRASSAAWSPSHGVPAVVHVGDMLVHDYDAGDVTGDGDADGDAQTPGPPS
jgi:hypothetical protein